MGVLDELQKEAEAIAAEKEREAMARAAATKDAREKIQPRMREAYAYFDKLIRHLQAVERKIVARYHIHGAGQVGDLVQGKYSVSAEDPENLDKFTFRCVCAKSGAFQVSLEDVASVASYRDYMRDNGLKGKARDTGRGRAVFQVQHAVPVVLEFTADYERSVIALRVRNLTELSVTRHSLTPEQLDDKLLDEIAKAILRTDHRFEEMVGDVLSRTGQIRLKKKFQEAVRQKEIEENRIDPEPPRGKVISSKLARALFRRKDAP